MTDSDKELILEAYRAVGCEIADGQAYTTLYVDYNDELSDAFLCELSKSNDPYYCLIEHLYDCYMDSCCEYKDSIVTDVRENDDSLSILFDKYNDDMVIEMMHDLLTVDAPIDHFLQQDMLVNIMVDTGDMNCDFTCNNWGPHYYAEYRGSQPVIDDNSSLLWLAKQQGANKTFVKTAIMEKDKDRNFKAGKFFNSLYDELNNSSSSMNVLTFCVRMTVEKYIELRAAMAVEAKRNKSYYANRRTGRGYIILDKNTTCGLIDPFSGSGSLLELAPESDVKLPIRYIYRAEQDGTHHYGIRDIYGCSSSLWTEGLKEIHKMKEKK